MKFFGASERQVREEMQIKAASGILGSRERNCDRPIREEMQASNIAFNEDDSVSYCLPGKKDYLQRHQKRICLINLKETHEGWKRTSDIKCGFSTFVALRSPHCVLCGGSGTHSVRVCMSHENVKLTLIVVASKKQH
ncbi:hypothetical protein HPB48_007920 [Haemaphysalis longicornis]|uniref:Uncharacterized protein n=1 Tax=Haemaphysalis longicornis TaxID=44386 RepID=A0A9J6GWB4_HAELO|nr:hypothetical protein HPB48_007920 [Haemaphysalis longicornis]